MLLWVPLSTIRAVGKVKLPTQRLPALDLQRLPEKGRCHLAHESDAYTKRASRAKLVAVQAEPSREFGQAIPIYERVPIPSRPFWPIAPRKAKRPKAFGGMVALITVQTVFSALQNINRSKPFFHFGSPNICT